MIHLSPDISKAKGWFIGPWDSPVPVPVGYANKGVDEPHLHETMFEIYLVARGESTALINEREVSLQAGDMLVLEPGEAHTFIKSSEDYFHFVIQTPFIEGDKVLVNS